MPILRFLVIFLITVISIHAKAPVPTQEEVLIWGLILFSIAMGSLLLIVHLFPKSDAYKKQIAAKIAAKANPITPVKVTVPPKKEEKKEDIVGDTTETHALLTIQTQQMPVTEPSIQTEPLTNITQAQETTSKTESVTSVTKTTPQVAPPPIQQTPVECKTVSFDLLYKSRLAEAETMCREHLTKLGNLVPSKSISIYFVKSGQFTRYLEKKGDAFSNYDPITERADISEDVVKFLRKKLGAFSSTHTDAVLPMVCNDELFGAIKIQFLEARKNMDINPVWNEIKSFAKHFHQAQAAKSPAQEKETNLYNLDHFNNILTYRITLEVPQHLSLIKISQTSDKVKLLSSFADALKEILGKRPEVYKVNEDTVGVFLNFENRDKLYKLFPDLLNNLRKNIKTVDLIGGGADFKNSYKVPGKWLEKAESALSESASTGPNKYKLFIEKA